MELSFDFKPVYQQHDLWMEIGQWKWRWNSSIAAVTGSAAHCARGWNRGAIACSNSCIS